MPVGIHRAGREAWGSVLNPHCLGLPEHSPTNWGLGIREMDSLTVWRSEAEIQVSQGRAPSTGSGEAPSFVFQLLGLQASLACDDTLPVSACIVTRLLFSSGSVSSSFQGVRHRIRACLNPGWSHLEILT